MKKLMLMISIFTFLFLGVTDASPLLSDDGVKIELSISDDGYNLAVIDIISIDFETEWIVINDFAVFEDYFIEVATVTAFEAGFIPEPKQRGFRHVQWKTQIQINLVVRQIDY